MRAVNLDIDPSRFDVAFSRPPLAERSGRPIIVGIGDDVVGPLIGLFYDAPSSPEQLSDRPDLTPAHGHPCDNFRIVMKGELWVGRERYHHGEFRLQRSGTPYGADGDAPHVDGNWRIIVFADRRGHAVRPTNRERREEALGPEGRAKIHAHFGAILPELLDSEEDGVDGLVSEIIKPFSRLGHFDASFAEADEWPVGDGGIRRAVTLLADHRVGPIAVVQRTPPNAVATTAFTIGSDVFRCVIAGSASFDGRHAAMGDARFRAAGVHWPEVIAGPAGLDEVIVVGDRSKPVTASSPWIEQVRSAAARLVTGLPAPRPVRSVPAASA